MRCLRKLLHIPYTAHRTNISVTKEVTSMIGEFELLIKSSNAANYSGLGQNRRQKVVNRGALRLFGGGLYVRIGGLYIQIWQKFH